MLYNLPDVPQLGGDGARQRGTRGCMPNHCPVTPSPRQNYELTRVLLGHLLLPFIHCICSCYHSLQGPSSSVLWLWPQPQSPLSTGLILSPVWGHETTSVQAAVQRSKTDCLSGVFSLACTVVCVCGWSHILHLLCPHYSWCPSSGCSHIHAMCLLSSVPTTSDTHVHLINASW